MENNEEINEMITETGGNNNDFDLNDNGFNSSFEKIIRDYDEVCRDTHSLSKENWSRDQKNFFDFFMKSFPSYLEEQSRSVSNQFLITKSHKNATLMVLPYYGFSFDESDDFFVYYLFSCDYSEIYLTLGLKVEGKEIDIIPTKNKFKKLIYSAYNSKSDKDFQIIDDHQVNLKVEEILNDTSLNLSNSEKIRLRNQIDRANNYENATIFSKKYEKNNFPDDNEFKEDLMEFLKLYKFIKDENIYDEVANFKLRHNLIYFGAPGTGKSFKLNDDKKFVISNENCFERVTFHPDYSYANFVGTYKPVSDENGDIKYKYVQGPFMNILSKAIKEDNKDKTFLLIIEEINRANMAAVFGDVFQLLDRDDSNCSRYEINASEDIEKSLGLNKIKIPSNMYIWATMNSADQGVYPMDTAFKRRWDFEYLDINNNDHLMENLIFTLDDETYYSWNNLRISINNELLRNNINEDKLIGPFFAFNEYKSCNIIPKDEFKEIFKNKIIMYLFEDVYKVKRNNLFSGVGINNVTFGQICKKFDDDGLEIFCKEIHNDESIFVKNPFQNTNED